MKTRPMSLPDGFLPRCRIELYQDPNGNWFASAQWRREDGSELTFSATYTTPAEALLESLARQPVRQGASDARR